MRQREVYSYVYDFLSQMMEKWEIFSKLNQIILFGSAARGESHKDSDIDIFIDSKHYQKIDGLIKLEINKFEERIRKTWILRGLSLPLKIIVSDLSLPQWKELREEIISYGIILFGPYQGTPTLGERKLLISYNLREVSQKNKMALSRCLFGYKSKKGKREYSQPGFLKGIGGLKMQANVVVIPPFSWPEIRKVLKRYGADYILKEIWMK